MHDDFVSEIPDDVKWQMIDDWEQYLLHRPAEFDTSSVLYRKEREYYSGASWRAHFDIGLAENLVTACYKYFAIQYRTNALNYLV